MMSDSIKSDLKKLSMESVLMESVLMESVLDGGEIALSGFIKNMEEVKDEIGDQSYPISAFIDMAKDFKGVWLECLTDKVRDDE